MLNTMLYYARNGITTYIVNVDPLNIDSYFDFSVSTRVDKVLGPGWTYRRYYSAEVLK